MIEMLKLIGETYNVYVLILVNSSKILADSDKE
jgi:hypothetical protein